MLLKERRHPYELAFPELKLYHKQAQEPLAAALAHLSRPEVFRLTELRGLCGFETKRSRSNYRLPYQPRTRTCSQAWILDNLRGYLARNSIQLFPVALAS